MRLWKTKPGERRRAGRRKTGFQARYRVLDAVTRGGVGLLQAGSITDISEAGCCLEVPAEGMHLPDLERCLELPRDYLLELRLEPASGGTWRLGATVRWIAALDGSCKVGLRFEEPVALPSFWLRLLTAPAGSRPSPTPSVPGQP